MNPSPSPSPTASPTPDLASLTRSLAMDVLALTLGVAAVAILWRTLIVVVQG